MRFSTSVKSLSKFAGLAAALVIAPIAVSCAGEPAADTSADVTSEVPTEEVPATTTETPTDTTATTGETIVDVAAANGSFNTLVAAVQAAGLEETLSGEGPYTVFAPTDEAFAALPEGTVEKLTKPENQAALQQILSYHVVEGEVPAAEIQSGPVGTVEGGDLEVTADAGEVTVNGASVVQPDVVASNGVIHVVDTVLLPPNFDPASLI
jgi:uncharacterized surface protein with fasciclin (FAS1) repeats